MAGNLDFPKNRANIEPEYTFKKKYFKHLFRNVIEVLRSFKSRTSGCWKLSVSSVKIRNARTDWQLTPGRDCRESMELHKIQVNLKKMSFLKIIQHFTTIEVRS